MKITGKKTYQETRANLDGKIIFIALAHSEFLDEIEKLIKGGQYKELADFLVSKFMLIAETYSGNSGKLNKEPIK